MTQFGDLRLGYESTSVIDPLMALSQSLDSAANDKQCNASSPA
jgi:hypothetical protein